MSFHRYPVRFLFATSLIAAAGALAGCTDNASVADGPTPTTRQALTQAKLDAAPPIVQRSFVEAHPEAAVSGVDVMTAESGVLYYEVTFIESGEADSVVYDQAGNKLDMPEPTTQSGS